MDEDLERDVGGREKRKTRKRRVLAGKASKREMGPLWPTTALS